MMLMAVFVDGAVGWPHRVYRRIGHPISWLGHLIRILELWLNRPEHTGSVRRTSGLLLVVVVLAMTVFPAALIQSALPENLTGMILGALISWPLIAARSLYDHVSAVIDPLGQGELDEACSAVARIVGRSTAGLDEAGIGRAALESLAENTSDAVIAPIFWGTILGLPGIVAYKAINTMDSMIGHRTDRYASFGWASARLDDVVNIIPARLTGLLFVVVSGRPRKALLCMWQDSGKHRSPNAGWPEAAMAGALGIRLSGPRQYTDRMADEPWVNSGAPDPRRKELSHALTLYVRALIGMAGILALLIYALSR